MDPLPGNLSLPQSQNSYAYGLGNPFLYPDPSGLCALDDPGSWIGLDDSACTMEVLETGSDALDVGTYLVNTACDYAIGVGGVLDDQPCTSLQAELNKDSIAWSEAANAGAIALVSSFVNKLAAPSRGLRYIGPRAYNALRKLIKSEKGSVNFGKNYKKAPDKLKAFPGAESAKGKSQVRGGGGQRARWQDKRNIYEWDYRHGRVEKYDKRGRHLGEYDPTTGAKTKNAVPGRRIEP